MGFFSRAVQKAAEQEDAKRMGQLDAVFELAGLIDEELNQVGKPESVKETLQMDLLDYCLLIARADGKITDEEVRGICKFIKMNVGRSDIEQCVNLCDAGGDNVLRMIPRSFIQLAAFAKTASSAEKAKRTMESIADLYSYIGGYIAGSDSSIDKREMEKIKSYSALLNTFIQGVM